MTKEKLATLLFDYGINCGNYHDESNKLSITILTPSKIGVKSHIIKSVNELTIIGDFEKDNENIIKHIKDFVIAYNKQISGYIGLVAKLSQIKYEDKRIVYQSSIVGSKNISDIKEYGFDVGQKWIKWNKYIPITVINYKSKIYNVDSSEMEKLGYGITSFKVLNDYNYQNGIYCEGNHPNVNKFNKKFCAEERTYHMKVNLNNLIIIKGLLSHINLNNIYNTQVHMEKLKHFVQEKT